MIDITSKNNDKIKDLIKIRDDKKFRRDKSLFYVEGERIISNISPELIDSIYILKDKFNNYKSIINNINPNDIYILAEEIFDKIKDTVNSQGIIALVKISSKNIDFDNINKILILDNIKDPGNLGTIIRTSEAAGIDLLILSDETVDVYNPKVVRASMSSITRINIIYVSDIISEINKLKNNGFHVYASYLNDNSTDLYKIKFNNKLVIIIGSESFGICKELIDVSDSFIKIPMEGKIESLNVSSATSIIIYEVYRQLNES